MSSNGHSDFNFDDFILDEDIDPLQIFRKKVEEEAEQTAAPAADDFYFSDDTPAGAVYSSEIIPEEQQVSQPEETYRKSPDEEMLFSAFQKKSAAVSGSVDENEPFALDDRAARLARAMNGTLAPTEQSKPTVQQYAPVAPQIRYDRAPVTVGETLSPDEILVYDSELDDLDYDDEEDLPEIRDYLPIRFRRTGRVGIGGGLLYALFVLSVSIVLAVVGWMFASDVLALNKPENDAVVTIDEYNPQGDDPVVNDDGQEIQVDIDQVAAALKNAGIIEYKWLFCLYSQFSNANVKIDPGTYDVSTNLDYRAIVTALQFGSGSQEVTRVTFPEGYTMDQIFALLEENDICLASDLYEAAANYDFDFDFLDDSTLGDANRLEGYLFPDTYDFYQGESPTVAITRFLNNTASKLSDDLYEKAASMGYSMEDIITIASMIEKEAGSDEERPIIASVIYNRLNSGMQLQLDSTIHYILASQGEDREELTYDDLEIESPYNTYENTGLPAGPICNPGLASIEAALNPENTSYKYFYAYDGTTYFFNTIDEMQSFAYNPVVTEESESE